MHLLKGIFCTIGSLLMGVSLLHAGGALGDRGADSLYQSLSSMEKVSKLVWIEAGQDDRPMGLDLTTYYKKPLPMPLPGLKGQSIAVGLDERLDPFPAYADALPGLATLAAIDNTGLVLDYACFLQKYARSYGLNYLVLPDTMGLSQRRKNVLQTLNGYDPTYFIVYAEVATNSISKKKQIKKTFQNHSYWVLNGNVDRHLKQLGKVSPKLLNDPDLQMNIKDVLSKSNGNLGGVIRMPHGLSSAISRASVVGLQRRPGMLPISSDTLCLITGSPQGSLMQMLKKYAYVITDISDICTSNAPILVDGKSQAHGIPFEENRTYLYVGPEGQFSRFADRMDAALVYNFYHEVYDFYLPQQLFGAADITGVLPDAHSAFENLHLTGRNALGYAYPEAGGLTSPYRQRIDSILKEAVIQKAIPGGQLAVAVGGAIVYEEAFGHLTYDSLIPVGKNTLYDLASVSKVAGTLLAVMKLYEMSKLDLDAPLSNYLPAYARSNKSDITLRSILSHNAGLWPYLPFWKKFATKDHLHTFYYKTEHDRKADIRSYGPQPHPALMDTLSQWILQSKLIAYDSVAPYSYSDLGFMILHQVVESVAEEPLDQFLKREFYQPLGLRSLTYNPMSYGFDRSVIAPTEYDDFYRRELIWGSVHDRNAALYGGVAGHSGLFSNSYDLVVLLQAILQGGNYKGEQVLKKETVNYFNQRYFQNNRRGLGWDKKDPVINNASRLASPASFGHTGFTGTMVWADPEHDIIFVFLSNRVHPYANNSKLIDLDIRTRIQDVVYEAVLAKWGD